MGKIQDLCDYGWQKYALLVILVALFLLLAAAMIVVIVALVKLDNIRVISWFGFVGLLGALALNGFAIYDEIRAIKKLS